MNVGELNAKISFSAGNFDRGVNKVVKSFSKLSNSAIALNQTLELLNKAAALLESAFENTVGSFIDAADTAEQYRITLDTVLMSTEEGARMFEVMTDFAKGVPYEYEKIMSSAAALAGVMEGGVDEVQEWMPMITDLAAVTRLSVEETTGQIIRMYSAGAASADLFRERGVLAMLGFTAGVSYSALETRERLQEIMNAPESAISGASARMAATWSGLISMLQDRWFLFRNDVMDEDTFAPIKQQLRDVLGWLDKLEESGKLEEWADNISSAITETVQEIRRFVDEQGPEFIEMAEEVAAQIWHTVTNVAKEVEYLYKILKPLTERLLHIITALQNSARGLYLAQEGILDFGQVAFANFDELKKILDDLDASPKLAALNKEAYRLQKKISDIRKYTDKGLISIHGNVEDAEQLEKSLDRIYLLIRGEKARIEAASDSFDKYKDSFHELEDIAKKTGKAVEKVVKPKVEHKEVVEANRRLSKQLADLQEAARVVRLDGLELDIEKAKYLAKGLREEFGKLFVLDPNLKKVIDQIEQVSISIAKAEDEMAQGERFQGISDTLQEELDKVNNVALTRGMSDYHKSILDAVHGVDDLTKGFEDLIAKSPELQQLVNGIKDAATKNVTDAAKDEMKALIEGQQEELDKLKGPDLSEYKQSLADINAEYEKLLDKGGPWAEMADIWKKNQTAIVEATKSLEEFEDTAGKIDEVLGAMVGPFTDMFADFAEDGKANLGDFASALVKELQMLAAAKSAEALMYATSEGLQAIIAAAARDYTRAAEHGRNAAIAAANASTYMGFIAGSGLAGMAHDGITTIPNQGTWLLDKGERVVDSETNADLKQFLQDNANVGGKPGLNMTVNINNSDEEGVMKALPKLRETVIEAWIGDYSSGGQTYQIVKNYG